MKNTEQMREALESYEHAIANGHREHDAMSAFDGISVPDLVRWVLAALTHPQEPARVGGVPEPVWIVNSYGELGVKVGERFFFLYKGDNIEYENATHDDDGTPMRYRVVGKREFGETCWPLSWVLSGRREDRYTVEWGEWRDLPPAPLTAAPQAPADVVRDIKWVKEMIDDTREVFDASGPETPQVVRDVIEYVKSWAEVYLQKRLDAAMSTKAGGV